MNAPITIDRSRLDPTLGATQRNYDLLIDGAWRKSESGATLSRTSPGHGATVSTYQHAGEAEVEAALTAARRAFDEGPWPRITTLSTPPMASELSAPPMCKPVWASMWHSMNTRP